MAFIVVVHTERSYLMMIMIVYISNADMELIFMWQKKNKEYSFFYRHGLKIAFFENLMKFMILFVS